MFTQGYIGVTNNVKKRFADHKTRTGNRHFLSAIKKYGWDNLVKTIVVIAEEAYCLMLESKLRSKEQTGWNHVVGGGMPPITRWNKGKKCLSHVIEAIKKANTGRVHTAEEKEKRRLAAIGRKMSEYNKQRLLEVNKGRISAMRGKHYPKVACPHCGKEGGIIPMKRWHMDNCKFIGVK
jgi:hypothetical protein